jgi:MFS family permease
MIGSILVASVIGFSSGVSYQLAAALVLLYGLFIWLDSSSLTAGVVGSAAPEHRGATLAVHSTLGYGGGFVGPLMIGWILDWAGGRSVLGWGLAFMHVAVVMLVGPCVMIWWRPKALDGDHIAVAEKA